MASSCDSRCDNKHCKKCIIKHNLGVALYKDKKYQKAVHFLENTSQFPLSNYYMGMLNYNGGVDGKIIIKTHYKTALKYFKEAAEQGEPQSQYMLGQMFYNGDGTTKNITKSIKWLTRSADQDNTDAQTKLGEIYLLDKDEIEHAYEMFKIASEKQDTLAQYNLATMYLTESRIKNDYKEAFRLFKLAADKEHINSMVNLGIMYFKGIDIKQNFEEAIKWYSKAAELNDRESQFMMGNIYYNGSIVELDYTQALYWFE